MLTNRLFPVVAFQDLRREMDRMLENTFRGPNGRSFRAGVYPPVNVWEDAENLFVEAELPGVPMGNLEIEVVGRDLSIKGRRDAVSGENLQFHRQERGSGEFSRFLTLPADVQVDKVSAVLRDGVLTITLPKADEARARKISVQGN